MPTTQSANSAARTHPVDISAPLFKAEPASVCAYMRAEQPVRAHRRCRRRQLVGVPDQQV